MTKSYVCLESHPNCQDLEGEFCHCMRPSWHTIEHLCTCGHTWPIDLEALGEKIWAADRVPVLESFVQRLITGWKISDAPSVTHGQPHWYSPSRGKVEAMTNDERWEANRALSAVEEMHDEPT